MMKKWEIVSKSKVKSQKLKVDEIIDILLKNRGLRTKKEKGEFLKPTPPEKITLKSLKISDVSVKKAISRIKKAVKNKERIIVYGDYDADGVCATAILWETLYSLSKKSLPYIPERFSEGYGLNAESVEKIKTQNPDVKLIITVDNGIVAYDGVKKANELGIDVIITDHHQKGKKLPKAQAIIHTIEIGGAGLAWVLARELKSAIRHQPSDINGLELAAIGTISDQLPLVGANRSFAKYGLEVLNKTKRPGLLALFEEAAIEKGSIGTYQVNFMIAPRLNAMGRLEHAIDSLRLLCIKGRGKAQVLARLLGKTNRQRQKVVGEVLLHASKNVDEKNLGSVIILAHETYHEGVIGLAASKLVEKFYRPAIVLSKGDDYSKASARSISGFNIIETLRKMEDMWVEGGGHPMAAGFTIETSKIDVFSEKFSKAADSILTNDLLTRRLKIDLEVDFSQLNWKLENALEDFEPAGIGNPTPTFATKGVVVLNSRVVGRDAKHIKLVLQKDDKTFGAIAFGFGYLYPKLMTAEKVDVAYNLMENEWMGEKKLELRVKDIKLGEQ